VTTAKPPAPYLVNYFPGYIEIEDEHHIKTPIRSVRCGLAAPSGSNPGGYFCLVGQAQRRLVTGHRALILLEDFSFQTTFQLLQTIFDRMGLYQAVEVWTDFSSSNHSFIEQIDLFWRQERFSQEFVLRPAPYADNFIQGERIIAKWLREIKGGLTLPKDSVVRAQLREIKVDDLRIRGYAAEKFWAINGLRYVLASFEAAEPAGQGAGTTQAKDLPTEAWT
jgi:hypothetical protein